MQGKFNSLSGFVKTITEKIPRCWPTSRQGIRALRGTEDRSPERSDADMPLEGKGGSLNGLSIQADFSTVSVKVLANAADLRYDGRGSSTASPDTAAGRGCE